MFVLALLIEYLAH